MLRDWLQYTRPHYDCSKGRWCMASYRVFLGKMYKLLVDKSLCLLPYSILVRCHNKNHYIVFNIRFLVMPMVVSTTCSVVMSPSVSVTRSTHDRMPMPVCSHNTTMFNNRMCGTRRPAIACYSSRSAYVWVLLNCDYHGPYFHL